MFFVCDVLDRIGNLENLGYDSYTLNTKRKAIDCTKYFIFLRSTYKRDNYKNVQFRKLAFSLRDTCADQFQIHASY